MAQQPSTDEDKPFVYGSVPLRLPRHELFAQKVAKGMTAKQAYKEMQPDCTDESAETLGPKLFRTVQVRDRVDYILGKAAQHVVMTKAEALAICVEILRTPIGEIDQNHPLAQEMTITETGEKVVTRVKLPSKLDALDKLAKICAWYAPEKFEGTIADATPEDVAARVQTKALELHGKADAVRKVLAGE